jgi:hypothetical protein
MKLADYAAALIADPRRGFFREWLVMAWGVWALLVKPETFRVADLEEAIELGTKGGMLRHVLRGVLMIVAGVGRLLMGVLGSTWLLVLLLLSPLILVVMRLAAHFLAWRSLRRRAKLLAEARADLTNRTPPH